MTRDSFEMVGSLWTFHSYQQSADTDGSMSTSEDQIEKSEAAALNEPPKSHSVTLEESYEDAIYSIVHSVGASDHRREELLSFLGEAFAVEQEKQDEFLQRIAREEKPKAFLEVDVERAENLIAKDPNGYSDPYCMLGVQIGGGSFDGSCSVNDIEARQVVTTRVAKATLNPAWNEKFKLEVEDIATDLFHLDIWDEDIEKGDIITTASKVTDVTSIRGLGRFFKQIAQSTKGSEAQDDFLGCVSVPLKEVDALGLDGWFELTSRFSKSLTVRGRIKFALTLRYKSRRGGPVVVEKDFSKSVQIYETLLTMFVEHQLRHAEDSLKWSGYLPAQATNILKQVAGQGNLTAMQRSLSKWIVYSRTSFASQLNYDLLHGLLSEFNKSLDARGTTLTPEQNASLAVSLRNFVSHSMRLIHKHRDIWPLATAKGQAMMGGLITCLEQVRKVSVACRLEESGNAVRMVDELRAAIADGSLEWLKIQIAGRQPMTHDNETVIKGFVEVFRVIMDDLRLGLRYCHDKMKGDLGVPFTNIVYKQYEKGIEDEELSSKVMDVVNRMDGDEAWATHGPDPNRAQDHSMRAGTKLYELYIALQEFMSFKRSLEYCSPFEDKEPGEEFKLHNFHEWFSPAVQNWFVMAKTKSKRIIDAAFKIDVSENKLKPLDEVCHSSSAIDASGCIKQIKLLWKELDWPDKAQSYPLIIRILEAICECALHYANVLSEKLESSGYYDSEEQFDVSDEVCVVLSNIDFVRNYILTISKDLQIKDVLEAIAANEGENTAIQCRKAIEAMINSTDGDVSKKISKIMDGLAEKMRPELRKSLDAAVRKNPDNDMDSEDLDESLIPVYEYLEENLARTYKHLETNNFYLFNQTLWRVMIDEIRDIAWQKRGSTAPYFDRLDAIVKKLGCHIHAEGNGLRMPDVNSPRLKELEVLLTRMRLPSTELEAQYFESRMLRQNDRVDALRPNAHRFGFLAVRAAISSDKSLHVHVLRARDLLAMDSNGCSDPYVKIELFPRHLLPGAGCVKSRVVKKSTNPVWDEKLRLDLPKSMSFDESSLAAPEFRSACVRFTVMDHDYLKSNDFEGESFLALSAIPVIAEGEQIDESSSANIVDMPLSQPEEDDQCLEILKKRDWESSAQKFARSELKKQIHSDD